MAILSVVCAAAQAATILVVGDSLSSAYGIRADRGWVELLEQRLKKERFDYTVANESISGETSAGGLRRIERALAQHEPAVVIIELGGNDGLRGLPVASMRNNLQGMIEQSQAAGARVLLVGMRMPPNYGPDYANAFEASFAELAKRYKTALVPFLLEGIGENEAMFLPDRIHPTEAAQPILLDTVWKGLRPLLRGK